MRFVVGVTGKIGSGKSTVSQFFSELGATVIDVDKVAHRILEREDVKQLLLRHFGDQIVVNRRVDRRRLASVVFSNPSQLLVLESIVHPILRTEVAKQVENLNGLVVIDAAILHRIGLQKLCDLIIVVKAPTEKIFERLKSKGFSKKQIEERLLLQQDIPDEGTIIVNDGDLKQLQEKVKDIFLRLIKSKVEST